MQWAVCVAMQGVDEGRATSRCRALPLPFIEVPSTHHWFARGACIVVNGENARSVFVGSALLGVFKPGERPVRYALAVLLSETEGVHLRKLCEAFEISNETLRRLRAIYKKEGIQGVVV